MEQPVMTYDVSDNYVSQPRRQSKPDRRYHIIQKNGQKVYEGPMKNWQGEPPQGTEVFIGHIPRGAQLEELIPIFEEMGEIYEFRLLMDFSKANRGYAFVRYMDCESADRAVDKLDNYELPCGARIGVMMSVDNRTLFINKIPNDVNEETVKNELEIFSPGVVSVKIFHYLNRAKARYAIVEYRGHREASLARRQLLPRESLFGLSNVKFEWAWAEVSTYHHLKLKTIFVHNLATETTDAEITDLFNQITEDNVVGVRKINKFAFVDFRTRDAAHTAFLRASKEKFTIEGREIFVKWSMPQRSRINSRGSSRRSSGGSWSANDSPSDDEQNTQVEVNMSTVTPPSFNWFVAPVPCIMCYHRTCQHQLSATSSIYPTGYQTLAYPGTVQVPHFPPPVRYQEESFTLSQGPQLYLTKGNSR